MKTAQSILIVEDNDILLDLLSNSFKMCGWLVFNADNGLDGWNLFNRETITIVLTDIQMPGIDGIELAAKIRNQSPNVKIALMSGFDDGSARDLLKNGTVDYFFKKPFSLGLLLESLMA